MKITEVHVHKLFNLGNYENMKIALSATVEEGEDERAVYGKLYDMIHLLFEATRRVEELREAVERKFECIRDMRKRISYAKRRIEELGEELEEYEHPDACTLKQYSEEELELMKLRTRREIERKQVELEDLEARLEREVEEMDRLEELRRKAVELLREGKVEEVLSLKVPGAEEESGEE